MATLVKFNRKTEEDARAFELGALRDVKSDIFPFATNDEIRSGRLAAHYLEASTKGDITKLAVFWRAGSFVDISYVMVGGIYVWGGFIPTENLESITISDRVTEGFYEIDVVIGGEALVLIYDPKQRIYTLPATEVASDAVLSSFALRKAA